RRPEQAIDVIDALAAEPAGVGRAESLLRSLGHRLGKEPRSDRTKQGLPLSMLALEEFPLSDRVLVDRERTCRGAQLHHGRKAQREFDEVVVKEWHARLQRVGHAQLVLDHQQTMQERASLEIQRCLQLVLRGLEMAAIPVERGREYVERGVI